MANILRNIFVIDDNVVQKISYYHLLLLMASLPFDMFFSHVILISFGAHTLLHLKRGSLKSVFKLDVLIIQAVFWVSVICIGYSGYKTEGWAEITSRALILIVPVIFAASTFDFKRYLPNLLLGFAFTCALTVGWLYVNALFTLHYYHLPLKTLLTPLFTKHNFSDPIGMHATFLSMQVGLALVYVLWLLMKSQEWPQRGFYLFCCAILSAGVMQLGSKAVFAAVVVAICIVLPFFAFKGVKRYRVAAIAIGIITFSAAIISRQAAFRENYITNLLEDMSPANGAEIVDPRLARWEAATSLIKKRPVLGYGSGSEISILKEEYFSRKLYNSYLKGLNAHNEYLSFLLRSGVIGLLVYLLVLGYGFCSAISTKNAVFCTFMLIIAIVSLSENVLDADKGITFYSLFFSLFLIARRKSIAVPAT